MHFVGMILFPVINNSSNITFVVIIQFNSHLIAIFYNYVYVLLILRLLEFLTYTRYTAVLEILNPSHQHVEDLSHLRK